MLLYRLSGVLGRLVRRSSAAPQASLRVRDAAHQAVEALERRTLMTAATPQPFHYDTAPHRVGYAFDSNVSAGLTTSDLFLENLTTNTQVPPSNLQLSYSTATNTGTFTAPSYTNG